MLLVLCGIFDVGESLKRERRTEYGERLGETTRGFSKFRFVFLPAPEHGRRYSGGRVGPSA